MNTKRFEIKNILGTNPIFMSLVFIPTIILLFAGLSTRSLWGPEGRWAEVVREMILTGNYFLPTINGRIYFDKPLLSYWVIVPFSLIGDVTEFTSRLPSVIFGAGVVFITYAIGGRLFNKRISFISAYVLSTSFMFTFWSKTASAEAMNLFMIWFALWVYISFDIEHNLLNVIIFYVSLAIAAFCKGPVAPAVILFSLVSYHVFETIVKKMGFQKPT